ncbi:MAG TPA: aromatic ring-hydroxylating dioxygenase subunit alpha [Candidatus Eremiobacteraceae bacterium]|nr:aromatic ring-hydroxylating dioxygenase subunit alpha [Candidatus Eremiobacteraceae bacterium]
MAVYQKASVRPGATTMPQRFYVSAEIFSREIDRVFSKRWLCVGRAEQIPNAGDYFLAELFGESLIIVRSNDGTVRAHFNVCRHRGTRMCEEKQGTFAGSIMCPYHAWTYGLDGTLLAARNMQTVEGFDKSRYPLAEAKLAQWEGFLFVNLAQSPAPFERSFAPVLERWPQWTIGRLRAAKRIDYDLRSNWKLIFQNYSECYHCPLIHPALDKLSPSESGRNDLSEGDFLGGYMTFRQPGTHGSMTLTGHTVRPPVGNVSGDNVERVYYYTIFPSMLLSLHPDYVMAHYLTPLSFDRTLVSCEWLFDPDTMTKPGFDPSDAIEFWDMTNRQDWHVCELSQAGISSRAYAPGPYGNQEGLLESFDRNYLAAMGE